MNSFLLDVKKILLGEDGSENTPLDFKDELTASLNSNIIDKAKATLLITARNNVDKLGNDIDKKQAADVSGKKILDKSAKKFQKELEAIELKENRKRKRDEEEERRKKEESLRQTMQRIAAEDEKSEFKENYKHKRRIDKFCKIKKTEIIRISVFY